MSADVARSVTGADDPVEETSMPLKLQYQPRSTFSRRVRVSLLEPVALGLDLDDLGAAAFVAAASTTSNLAPPPPEAPFPQRGFRAPTDIVSG
jgi:hypothetical protein